VGNIGNKKKQKGFSLMLAVMAMLAIVPLLGLVVDIGFLYGAKAHLQASVDGAALAGARAIVLDAAADTNSTNTVNNAATWFYANFPTGTWGTTGTVMTKSNNVKVYDDCSPPGGGTPANCNYNLWHVDVSASTQVPTYFMRWFGSTSNTINAVGKATRRNVAAMLVLDRSGSMCQTKSTPCGASTTTPAPQACAAMISAAKQFVGQFADGKDYIGMVTFNTGFWITTPVQNFRSVLGYTDALGNSNSGSLALDNIKCTGGTGTAQALAAGYNELYKLGQQGALNVIVLETDGLPNTLTMNWWDNANTASGISATSGCTDANGKNRSQGGWATSGAQRTWFTTANYTNTSYPTMYAAGGRYTAPTGPAGAFYTNDPAQGQGYQDLFVPYGTSDSDSTASYNSTATPGCSWGSITPGSGDDFTWFPKTDIYGAQLNPPTCSQGAIGPCAYNPTAYGAPVTTTGGYIDIANVGSQTANYNSAKAAVMNALDNTAYNIRADYNNSTVSLKPVIYTIGLGGNTGDPPDLTLLQRIANDPNGDLFNATPQYYACSDTVHNPRCITFQAQQQGRFIYSSNASSLHQAFLTLAGQMLRLSQ
jgi:hypothetical protein